MGRPCQTRSETEFDHPVAVAELLSEQGFDDTVVAAALLHDNPCPGTRR